MKTGCLWAMRMKFIVASFFIILLMGCASQYEIRKIDCTRLREGCLHREAVYSYKHTKTYSALGIAGTGLGVAAAAIPPVTFYDFGKQIPINTINSNLSKNYPECKGWIGWDELFRCVKRIDISEGRIKEEKK
jgi:hypothetical protein